MTRQIIVRTCVLLFLLSELLFLVNIQFPKTQNFDEFHYVPSAKQYLALKVNQNIEHPPLAKLFMAVGIAIFGDRPIGWRFMSTVFGALTLVGMYLWGLSLFKDQKTAIWIALVCLFNQLLYVQARIGMLDTFMFAFMAWSAAAFCATVTRSPDTPLTENRKLLAASGILIGLGMACKWFALLQLLAFIGLIMVVRIGQFWKARKQSRKPSKGSVLQDQSLLWKDVRWQEFVIYLGIYPILAYFVCFIPTIITQPQLAGISSLLDLQKQMYELQLLVVKPHPYNSKWPQWITMTRPIWYAFDHDDGGDGQFIRGVLLLGNPLVMWPGLAALLGCAWGWIWRKDLVGFLILMFYAAFFVSWIVIPRTIAFYYYYYPAGMVLAFALAYSIGQMERAWNKMQGLRWIFLAGSFGFFIYFFPILAALRIPAEEFRKWMWLKTWI